VNITLKAVLFTYRYSAPAPHLTDFGFRQKCPTETDIKLHEGASHSPDHGERLGIHPITKTQQGMRSITLTNHEVARPLLVLAKQIAK
jgi:hypothetical protein